MPTRPTVTSMLSGLRLRTRVLAPVVVGCVATAGIAFTGFAGQQSLGHSAHALQVNSNVLQNQQSADGLHDTVHADVLAVLLDRDPAALSRDVTAISADASALLALQDANQRLMSDPALLARLTAVRPALDDYAAQAEAVGAAATGPGGQTAAQVLLPAFTTAFDTVAEQMGKLSEQIKAAYLRTAEQSRNHQGSVSRQLLIAAAVALLLTLSLGLAVSASVLAPVRRLAARLHLFADGDLSAAVQQWAGDELGDMGRALERAQASLAGALQTMDGNATTLAAASEELSATAATIATSADQTTGQSGIVSGAAQEVSRNVQTLATGADEMGASIREISQNASEAARVGASAVTAAEATTATISRLGDSSRQIGDVVKVITSIAAQTNLLALNATIEAARAGEAGKGFAVVAGEVKDLAQETAKATEDIRRRVEAIQVDTAGAVTAIAEISAVIARMNEIQTTIASAVEEQTATTAEMSRNVNDAALASGQIADNITGVAAAAQTTSSGIQDTQLAAADLARMSAELQTLVGRFRY